MNLSTIRNLLNKAPIEKGNPLTVTNSILHNLEDFKRVMEALEEIPPFQRGVRMFRESSIYSTSQDDLILESGDQARKFRSMGDELILAAVALKNTLNSILPKIPEESVVVTLPANNGLAPVIEIMSEIEGALGHLVRNERVGGDLEIVSWETGSLSLVLFLQTAAAVLVVGRLLKSAALAYQEMQKGRLIGQQVQSLKIKNESLQDIREAQADLLKELVDREARALETETFGDHQPERFERVKHSIRTLADLLDKGTRITPALEMPANAKEAYPDFQQLAHSSIKELTQPDQKNGEPVATS